MYAPMVKRQRSGSMSLSHTMQEIGIEDLSELLSTLGSASEDEDDNRLVLGYAGSHQIRGGGSGRPSPQRRSVMECGDGACGPLAVPLAIVSAAAQPIVFSSSKKRGRPNLAIASVATAFDGSGSGAPAPPAGLPVPVSRARAKQMRKNVRERQRREEVNANFENLSDMLGLTTTTRARYDKVTVLSRASQEITTLRAYKRSAEAQLVRMSGELESMQKRQRLAAAVPSNAIVTASTAAMVGAVAIRDHRGQVRVLHCTSSPRSASMA